VCASARHFVLPYAINDNPRIRRVEHLGPWYVHEFRVVQIDELDEELRQWLCASYRLMGNQHRFEEC
jgi:hypothetical protein